MSEAEDSAQLQARIAKLEGVLAKNVEEVIVLRSAVAYLTNRVDELEKRSKGQNQPRPKSAWKENRDKTPATPDQKEKSDSAAPSPATPSGNETPQKSGSAQKPSERKYNTLPRHTKIDLGKSPSSENVANGDAAVVEGAPAEPSPLKKTPSQKRLPPKVLHARTPSDGRDEEFTGLDPARKGTYLVNGRKIHFAYPPGVSGEAKADAPDTELKLEYAFGFNGRGRDNLFWANSDAKQLIYSVAGAGVVFDVENNAQRFFLEHTEDVLSLAVHPSKPIVATGQLDPKGSETPFICIWDSNTMQLLKRITYHDRGVIGLAFSPGGQYLVSVGADDNHTVALWDWENHRERSDKKKELTPPLIDMMCSKDQVFAVAFNPHPRGESKGDEGELEFITLGVKHIKVWNASDLNQKDKKLRKLQSRIPSTFGKTKVVQKAFHNVAFMPDGSYAVGTQSGAIYVINGTELVNNVNAHEGIVGGIVRTEDGFASIGDDGKLKLWDNQFKELQTFALTEGKDNEPVNSRSLSYRNRQFAVGTKSNSIILVNRDSGDTRVVMEGHWSDVWGLAAHPTEKVLATGAHDHQLRLWNYEERKATGRVFKADGKDQVRSALFSKDGRYLAVGTNNGNIVLLDYSSFEVVWTKNVAKETIDALAFSPDGSLLAAGSWDQMIYLVAVPGGDLQKTLKGHTSSVLHAQFSKDGKVLMTDSKDYEILYWDVSKGKRIGHMAEVADLEWDDWSCFLGWPVQGIWEGANDGTDINAVARSHDQKYLVAGDDFGKVRLFRYPVLQKDAPSKQYPGHSSHVTNVTFAADDAYVFSAGGNDTAVFVWRNAH